MNLFAILDVLPTLAPRMSPYLFSTRNSQYLAELICKEMSMTKRKNIERWQFDDGEEYYRIDIDDRAELMGSDAIMIGSTHTDTDLLEVYRVGCGLAEHGTDRRIFIIPFFGYSTMERAVKPGEVVTAKKNARMLSSIPNNGRGNVFLFMDVHTPGLIHYFEGDCLRYELHSDRLLIEAVETLKLKDPMFASADLGRPQRVRTFADHFGTDIAMISKARHQKQTIIETVVGEVTDKCVVIYDDMTRSGGTLIKAAEAYIEAGAKEVYAVMSHLAFTSEKVVDAILDSPIKKIISTNSHPMSQSPIIAASDRFIICDIAPLFAAGIEKLIAK
jgi:ribose-phosphate pyrophosphokinase